jgi:transcription elongation GreA/GreB family factor
MDKDRTLALLKDMQRNIDANRNDLKRALDRNQEIETIIKQLAAMIRSQNVKPTKKKDDRN